MAKEEDRQWGGKTRQGREEGKARINYTEAERLWGMTWHLLWALLGRWVLRQRKKKEQRLALPLLHQFGSKMEHSWTLGAW